nr:hypothetical protein [Tanacetum cinerariifolium]
MKNLVTVRLTYITIKEALNASKDLDNLLGSQRSDKNKEGLGFNVVPPSPAQVYSPPKKDLSWTGLPEFVDDTVTDYMPTPNIDGSKCNTSDLQSSNFYVSEHEESSGSIMSKPMIKFVKEVDCPRVIKTNKTENARKSTVKYAEMVEKGKTWPKDNYAHKRMTPRAVLLKPGTTPIVVSRPNMNVAQPKMTSFAKTAHSNVKRPFQGKSAVRIQPRVPRVSNVTKIFPTVDLKFPTAKSTFTANLGNKGKAVKASACWIWRPKQNTTENGPNCNGVSVTFKKYQYIDTQGRLRFTWTFFLKTKDETSSILRNFITEIENIKDLKVKIIMCDNGGEFKNKEMNELCTKKGIRREFSNARTPQQNRVAERRNKTLIEAARTMCHVVILNTLDHLGKFDAKGDEGYFVGYSLSSKAFRVFNKRTKKVEENMHVDFLENKLIEKGAGPNWLFDIDTLTNSMNYVPVVIVGTSFTNISGTKEVASQAVKKDVSSLRYIALPNWFHEAHMEAVKKDVSSLRYIALPNWFHEAHMETSNAIIRDSDAPDDCNTDVPESSEIPNPTASSKVHAADQVEPAVSLTVESKIPTISSPVPTVCLDISIESSSGLRLITKGDFNQKETPSLGNALTLSNTFEDTFGMEADLSNMETSIPVSPTPTFRIHKDHPKSQIIGPVDTLVQTRHKSKEMEELSFIALIHQKTNLDLLQFCLFLCFLSQEEPKKIFDALKDLSWVEAMQEELLQFKIQN